MTSLPIDQLIDTQRGLISREIFVSPEFHKEELEKVFSRAWLFVGHESQIPNPGDYFVSRMGDEFVILCRDAQGKVHVFLNSCRHRGMKVCRYEQGNTSLFVCPYHSWSYGTDGKLQGVPLYRALYEGTLDRAQWSLIETPKLQIYKSTVWASWDPEAPDLMTYLGDAVDHLDQVLDCRDGRPGGSEVIGVQKWILPTNWKFAAENFLGDTYHNPSHRSVDMIGIGPSAQRGQRRDNEYAKGQHVWVGFPQGHGMHSVHMPEQFDYQPGYAQYPEVEEYFRQAFYERQRRLGGKARLLPFTGNLFPNTSWHGRQPRALCVWHPHSTTETEAWRFFLVDADAPAVGEGRAAALLHALFRSRRHDRAGRHGKLALRDAVQPRHDRAALSIQLSDVDGRVQGGRSHSRHGLHPDHRPDAAQLLPRLRALHEGRSLGSVARP